MAKFPQFQIHLSSMRKPIVYGVIAAILAVSTAGAVLQANNAYQLPESVNPIDVVWVLVSGCLVLFMTPGVAFFYGGMVKHNSFISTMMQIFACMGIITFMWICFGLSMTFGDETVGGIFGNPFNHFMLWNVDSSPPPQAPTLPFTAVAAFELTFAIITPSLIAGAFSQRIKFASWMIFIAAWHILVYCPLAHMVWNSKGILFKFGVQDFAGGIVVEMASGVASLMSAWYIGPRQRRDADGESITAGIEHTLLGTGILWFGWLGFNAGSSYTVDGISCQAFLTTNAAASTGMLIWMLLEVLDCKTSSVKISVAGLCNGAVVGLVAITPACGYVTLGGSFIIGIGASISCYYACHIFRAKSSIDDSLEVFCIHGVGGIVGTLLTGVFSSSKVNPNASDGLIYGNVELFLKQVIALVILIPVVALMTYICLLIADWCVPLRVGATTEQQGLDIDCIGSKLVEQTQNGSSLDTIQFEGSNFALAMEDPDFYATDCREKNFIRFLMSRYWREDDPHTPSLSSPSAAGIMRGESRSQFTFGDAGSGKSPHGMMEEGDVAMNPLQQL